MSRSRKAGHRFVTYQLRPMILRREHYRCRICQRTLPEEQLTIDHIKPLCLGGKTERRNLRCLCHHCHNEANRVLSRWLNARARGDAVSTDGWRLSRGQIAELRRVLNA